jgi:transcriptional regulator with XRE-family HTH domain
MADTIDAEVSEAGSPRGLPKLPKMLSRNSEIGKILQNAREYRNIPVTKCAELVGTSRRRYLAMEEGKATIGAVELEELVRFLGVPVQRVWRIAGGSEVIHELDEAQAAHNNLYQVSASMGGGNALGAVTLRILPGQTITLVVGEPNGVDSQKKPDNLRSWEPPIAASEQQKHLQP